VARRNRPKDLRRRAGTRRELRTVVVFCEGQASEPDYLNAIKRLPSVRANTAIRVEVDPGQGVPSTLVRRAIKRLQDNEVDECWCVFDVEWPQNHPHLKTTVDLAQRHGVRLAITDPCFELWLILHHQDQTAWLHTSEAERLSRNLDGRPGKRIEAAQYLPLRAEAARRAAALRVRHAGNGTLFPDDNPSSSLDLLLEALGA
jgi:hypothetical protein